MVDGTTFRCILMLVEFRVGGSGCSDVNRVARTGANVFNVLSHVDNAEESYKDNEKTSSDRRDWLIGL